MKIEKNQIFDFAQILLSAYWSASLTYRTCANVLFGGMKKQHDAILESFGTTEEIILFTHSLTVNNLLSSFLFSPTLKTLKFPLLLPFSIFEIILSQILT